MLSKNKHSLAGTFLFIVLILTPVVLWLADAGLEATFLKSPGGAIASLGKASALAALTAFALMPILAMRHRFIEQLFGGLGTVYKLHRNIGKIIFILIFAHPILLLGGRMVSGRSFVTAWDWASLVVISGLTALAVINGLILIALYAQIKHQKWIKFHRVLGWFLPVLFFHALVARSQVVTVKPLLIFTLVLGMLGFVAFLYRSVFTLFVHRYRYVIAEVNHPSPSVTELLLKPERVSMTYTPGQFAFVSFDSDVVDKEPHPFSFTTGNNGPYLRFAVKDLGDDTAKYKNLTPGTKVLVEGPYGKFDYKASKNRDQVWIAGGVGITPFLSMARSLNENNDYKIHLFYAADKLEDAVFLRELMAIKKTLPDTFNLTLVNRQWSGFLSADILSGQVSDLNKKDYFICGPPPMMKAVRASLNNLGVSSSRIHSEEFSMR